MESKFPRRNQLRLNAGPNKLDKRLAKRSRPTTYRKKAATRRESMQGAENFDPNLHHQLNKTRTTQQNQELLMIQSGGLWTAGSLQRAGYVESALCPYCKQEAEDLHHLWWVCPQHSERRKQVREMLGNDHNQLPRCLKLHGIPVQPNADITRPLWTPKNEDDGQREPPGQLAGEAHFVWIDVLQDLSLHNDHDLDNVTGRQLVLQMQ